MAFQISLSSKEARIIREYKDGIPLKGPYEVGLKHFVFWNTIFNITEDNNTLHIFNPDRFESNSTKPVEDVDRSKLVTITPGYYELDDIIEKIESNDDVRHSATVIKFSKYTFQIKISSEWIIDFSPKNSIGKLLGFSKQIIYPNVTARSDLPVDIFSINSIKIHCNLIRSNVEDFKRNVNILYDFPLDCSKVGTKIIKEVNPICYYMVNTDTIYDLVITITDQDNKLIDFRGELLNLTLHFRPITNNG